MLAILIAGGCCVPVETNLPLERQHDVLKLSSPKLVVCKGSLLPPAESSRRWLNIDDVPSRSPEEVLARITDCRRNPLVYILFTSGSTGRPKGIKISPGRTVQSNRLEWSLPSRKTQGVAVRRHGIRLQVFTRYSSAGGLVEASLLSIAEKRRICGICSRSLRDGRSTDFSCLLQF